MKRVILTMFISCFLYSFHVSAQVVFCPPGAEWNYHFGLTGYYVRNEKITYVRDSMLGSQPVKVLQHLRYYPNCNQVSGMPPSLTLIKQSGDTVFFSNARTPGWQILYDFSAVPGQSWQTKIADVDGGPSIHTFLVNSVSTVTINGMSLKQLTMNNNIIITERIGSAYFMFNVYNYGCHGELIAGVICYKDDVFGLKKFTQYECNSEGDLSKVGLEETYEGAQFSMYPNPFQDYIEVKTVGQAAGLELRLCDVSGREIKRLNGMDQKIDLRDLTSGIYFLTIAKNGRSLYTRKVIKE